MGSEEEIRPFPHFGNGGTFTIFGFASLFRHRFHQANVKVGDRGCGQLIKLLIVKVVAVAR